MAPNPPEYGIVVGDRSSGIAAKHYGNPRD
jgi:hypothetical protein